MEPGVIYAKHILNGHLSSKSMEKKINIISQVSLPNRSSITGILLYIREIVLKNKISRIEFDDEDTDFLTSCMSV